MQLVSFPTVVTLPSLKVLYCQINGASEEMYQLFHVWQKSFQNQVERM